ncbi:MAG: hypothetical protein FWH36_02765 [Lentimicrobiaceae bacterium]|nr:hypothetical protein [Lentimicrobiaceae bacterium]
MVSNGKAKIEKTFDGLNIIVPSKKNWSVLLLLFGVVWIGFCFLGFLTFLHSNTIESDSGVNVVLVFGIAWIVSGFTIAFMFLWGYFGQEKFIMSRNEVFFEKTIFNIGVKNRLDISEIKNFRTAFVDGNMFDFRANMLNGNAYLDKCLAFWGLGTGKIKFDYGLKPYSFGLSLDDAEANYIVGLLKEQFKEQ